MRRNARQVKTYIRNPKERNHRDHRSRKNRRKIDKLTRDKLFGIKRKIEELEVKELEDEAKKSF